MKGQGVTTDSELNVNGRRRQYTGYVTDILTDESIKFFGKRRNELFLLYVSHKALHPNITQRDDGSATVAPSGRAGFVPAKRHEGMYANIPTPWRLNAFIAPTDKPTLM